jgi:hypothetical protein
MQGTKEQALELAKVRFAQRYAFDLHADTWLQLFDAYRANDILQALTQATRTTKNVTPERVHQSLVYWCSKLERQRQDRQSPAWPPSDVDQL